MLCALRYQPHAFSVNLSALDYLVTGSRRFPAKLFSVTVIRQKETYLFLIASPTFSGIFAAALPDRGGGGVNMSDASQYLTPATGTSGVSGGVWSPAYLSMDDLIAPE